MSFGFGIGDFIAVSKLAHEVHQRLTGASSEFKQMSKEIKRLEFLMQSANVTLSGAIIEDIEREKLSVINDDTRRKLEDLDKRLSSIQELGLSNHSMRGKVKRIWSSLRWDVQEIRDLQNRIMDNVALQNMISEKSSLRVLIETNAGVDYLMREKMDQDRRSILEWLCPIQFDRIHDEDFDELQAETGRWMLTDKRFLNWLDKTGQTLFCPGIAGAGKSSLTAIVSGYLSQRFGKTDDFAIACSFCDFKNQMGHTAENLLSNILRQLVKTLSIVPDDVRNLCQKHVGQHTRPNIRQLSETIVSVTRFFSRVFILVDGLDELSDQSGSRYKLLDELFVIQKRTALKLFATSRPLPQIEQRFANDTVLEIRASDDDVKKYVTHRLLKFRKLVQDDPELRSDIEIEIVRRTQGMFLLAKLYLNSLQEKLTVKSIKATLRTFSESSNAYDDAYEDTLSRIKGQPADHATFALQSLMWLTCSRRSMTISELRVALTIEENDTEVQDDGIIAAEDLLSICGGLVTVDSGGVVRFIHQTVHEYLKRTQERWFPNAEAVIARCCLTYLAFPVFNAGFRNTKDYDSDDISDAFFGYAATYWVSHARLGLSGDKRVSNFIKSGSKIPVFILFWASQKRHHSFMWSESDTYSSQSWPPTRGKEEDVVWLIEQGVDVNSVDETWATPLHYAVLNSWTRCVSVLLDLDAKIHIDIENMTPLHYAVSAEREDNKSIIKCFIDHHVSIDVPVIRAIWRQEGQVNRLQYQLQRIDRGPSTSGDEKAGLTPLHYAALTGSSEMTEYLLSYGADPNATSVYLETPLHLTLRGNLYGPERPNQIDRWTDPDSRLEGCEDGLGYGSDDEEERAGVMKIIDKSRQRIFDLLLEHGTSPGARDVYGATFLHHAGYNNKVSDSMFQRLLSIGVDISYQDCDGRTSLHLACASLAKGKVMQLLNHGADTTITDSNGLNPFHSAACGGDKEILQTMKDYTTLEIITAKDHYGRNALHHLVRQGLFLHREAVQLLISWGVDPNEIDKEGKTPLALFNSQKLFGSDKNDDIEQLLNNHAYTRQTY